MSCGHAVTPQSLTGWCRSLLDQVTLHLTLSIMRNQICFLPCQRLPPNLTVSMPLDFRVNSYLSALLWSMTPLICVTKCGRMRKCADLHCWLPKRCGTSKRTSPDWLQQDTVISKQLVSLILWWILRWSQQGNWAVFSGWDLSTAACLTLFYFFPPSYKMLLAVSFNMYFPTYWTILIYFSRLSTVPWLPIVCGKRRPHEPLRAVHHLWSRQKGRLPVLLAVSEAMERPRSALWPLQQLRVCQPRLGAHQELPDHRPARGAWEHRVSLHPGLSHLWSEGGARQNRL